MNTKKEPNNALTHCPNCHCPNRVFPPNYKCPCSCHSPQDTKHEMGQAHKRFLNNSHMLHEEPKLKFDPQDTKEWEKQIRFLATDPGYGDKDKIIEIVRTLLEKQNNECFTLGVSRGLEAGHKAALTECVSEVKRITDLYKNADYGLDEEILRHLLMALQDKMK